MRVIEISAHVHPSADVEHWELTSPAEPQREKSELQATVFWPVIRAAQAIRVKIIDVIYAAELRKGLTARGDVCLISGNFSSHKERS